MKRTSLLPLFCAGLLLAGCAKAPEPTPAPAPSAPAAEASAAPATKEEKIEKALAALSEEDRVLAKAQKLCAVSEEGALGSMGTPIKITLEGKPVFLCCEGCVAMAEKEPAKALARVAQLTAASAAPATEAAPPAEAAPATTPEAAPAEPAKS